MLRICLFGVAAALGLAVPALARAARSDLDQSALALRLATASPGDVIELPAGVFQGPLVIDRPLTLRAAGGTILDGGGRGTVLRIEAPGVVVEGLTVRASGRDVDGPDACIFVAKPATGAVLRDNRLSGCTFGIWVHETVGARLLGNHVEGARQGLRSERGNGIHLFNASRLLVAGNRIVGGRDGIYIAATEDSRIEDNHMENTRFGVHYMFSYRNFLRGNRSLRNVNGYALMESHDIQVVDNEASGNRERGILFRDAQGCTITGNRIEANGEGLFFYSSVENRIEGNLIRGNDIGAKVWAGTVRNLVEGNRFLGNRVQVFYVGSENLRWGDPGPGNEWGDYLGWDQNGDGIGDRPYRVDTFTAGLVYRYPGAALLLRSPTLELLSYLYESMPILRVPTLVDLHPRVAHP